MTEIPEHPRQWLEKYYDREYKIDEFVEKMNWKESYPTQITTVYGTYRVRISSYSPLIMYRLYKDHPDIEKVMLEIIGDTKYTSPISNVRYAPIELFSKEFIMKISKIKLQYSRHYMIEIIKEHKKKYDKKMLQDDALVDHLLLSDINYMKIMPAKIRKDRNKMLMIIDNNVVSRTPNNSSIDKSLRDDDSIMIPLIRRYPSLYNIASERIKCYSDLIYSIVNQSNESRYINHIPNTMLSDKEFVLEYIKRYNNNLESYHRNNNSQLIKKIDPELFEDIDFVENLLTIKASYYKWMPIHTRNNHNIITFVVRNCKDYLRWLPEEYKDLLKNVPMHKRPDKLKEYLAPKSKVKSARN